MSTLKEECEAFLEPALAFAEQMLKQHGEFFPFGLTLSEAGEIAFAATASNQEQPTSHEIIEELETVFRSGASARELKATALVVDVRVVPPTQAETTDAVSIRLDHRDNYSVVVYFPYRIRGTQLELLQPFASPGKGAIFA